MNVTTKRLNEQYRRNQKRFPEDFALQLTAKETQALRSQVAASSSQMAQNQKDIADWSQNEISSQRHRRPAYRPYAFTEHGALQGYPGTANLFRSARAIPKAADGLITNLSIVSGLAGRLIGFQQVRSHAGRATSFF